VRELKLQVIEDLLLAYQGRTLPRVRELKPLHPYTRWRPRFVAPFPGCVN